MAITLANLKLYQCLVWTEGDSHGGDIDVANEIAASGDQTIFDDVTNPQRITGAVEYRKVFIKNLNADTWEYVIGWITQSTAPDDTIAIKLGTNAGVQSVEGVAAGYVSPTSKTHVDKLELGNLDQDEYQAIWVRRTTAAGGDGYTAAYFQLVFENS